MDENRPPLGPVLQTRVIAGILADYVWHLMVFRRELCLDGSAAATHLGNFGLADRIEDQEQHDRLSRPRPANHHQFA